MAIAHTVRIDGFGLDAKRVPIAEAPKEGLMAALHSETLKAMTSAHRTRFVKTQIPFVSDIERMGVHRAAVMVTAPTSRISKAYRALHTELKKRTANE